MSHKKLSANIIAGLGGLAMLALAAQAPLSAQSIKSSSTSFSRMEIVFHTTGDGKNSNTKLDISIVQFSGAPTVAHFDVGGSTIFDKDADSMMFTVPSSNKGFDLSQLATEQLLLKIDPPGNDSWTFGLDAKLHFEDGTTALLNVKPSGIKLDQNHKQILLKLSDAKIIPAGGR